MIKRYCDICGRVLPQHLRDDPESHPNYVYVGPRGDNKPQRKAVEFCEVCNTCAHEIQNFMSDLVIGAED